MVMYTELIYFFEKLDYIVYSFIGSNNDINEINKLIYNEKYKYIIFFHNDYEYELNLPLNVLLFRASLVKSKKKTNELIYPVSWVHERSINIQLYFKKPHEKPTISFCGSIVTYKKRYDWLETLKNSDLISCNFVYKQGWANGTIDEFLNNMQSSEFIFCPRGTGNFSLRFYETLCYGRIPVVIDTDIELPFEREINWNDIIVIDKDINKLPEKILKFWENNNIEEVQLKCKNIYEQYFKSAHLLDLYKIHVDNYFNNNMFIK